jgi:hypothetical protein
VPPIVVIAADVLVVLCPLLVLRAGGSGWTARSRLLPALPLASIALLLLFVFGEDSYRGNGITRWDAYRSPGGALEPMFLATVGLMGLAAGSMVVGVLQHRRRLIRASAQGAALVALLLGIPTVIGFSAN